MANKFKVGDIVISKKGTKPAVVTSVYCSGLVGVKYIHNDRYTEFNTYKIKLYTEEDSMTAQTLYSFTTTEGIVSYGYHIGTNTQNKWLIEEKPTGTIHVLDKDQLEEVVPYTFSVIANNTVTHYVGQPDTVKVGDVFIVDTGNNPALGIVNAVNTKNKSTTKKFKGARVLTELYVG